MRSAAKSPVTLEECYRTLQLKPGADLDNIKKSFRKLAFSLHPDLNPNDPAASKKFQRLNEAYVILKRVFEGEPAKKKPQSFRQGKGAPGTAAGPTGTGRPESSHHEPDDTRGDGQGARRRFNQYAKQQAYAENPEDVLQDILKDPFARQVYEDIFRSAGRSATSAGKGGGRTGPAASQTGPAGPTGQAGQASPASQEQVKRQISLEWGERSLTLDLSQGLWSGIKSWMSGQMDEEQTVYLPPHMLLPGKLIRIRIRRGLSGDGVPVEVRLPIDFVVGRPLRLKGMGRRIGPLKGDLYLRLLAR